MLLIELLGNEPRYSKEVSNQKIVGDLKAGKVEFPRDGDYGAEVEELIILAKVAMDVCLENRPESALALAEAVAAHREG